MEITILNVSHAFCSYVVADNGMTMLIDCGYGDSDSVHPLGYLLSRQCQGINAYFVLNYDEDHLNALPGLRAAAKRIPIRVFYRNKSISAEQLRALKQRAGPLGKGMKALLDMIKTGSPIAAPVFPNFQIEFFHNNYPDFTDTNNLSVVLFLHYPGFSIVFPGDLEAPGWKSLLQLEAFRKNLSRVNVLVASHHGRDSGYTKEIFDYCSPDLVIISDKSKVYETQEVDYTQHAKGISCKGRTRKVLTTRLDKTITLNADAARGWSVTTGTDTK